MKNPSRAAVLTLALFVVSTTEALGLGIGESAGPVPLIDSAGLEISMRNYDEYRATAVLFLSSRCRATEKSIAEINALFQQHRRKEILYVGVCSNNVETADELREFMQKRGMIFSIYRDPSGSVAEQFGARATPELFLLDDQGRLIFRSGLDSSRGRKAFAAAIQNHLDDKPIARAGTRAKGTPIDNPGEKIDRDDRLGAIAFSSELLFEKIPGAAVYHCSTVTQAANGDLLCLWYGGSFESADDQVLFLSRRQPGQRDWNRPEVLIQDSRQPPGNGLIFVDGRDRVWIVWCRMESTRPIIRGTGWDHCRLMSRVSTDNGETWSPDREMLGDDELVRSESLWFVPRNPPVIMNNGTLVLGLEAVLNDTEGSIFLTTGDHGRSWRRGGFTSGGSQPALVERSDGSLLALMRRRPRITQIVSHDEGKNWSQAEATGLRNPDAGISMAKLKNGHLVLVFNDTSLRRTPLSIVRSLDEGKTWESPLKLESNPGEYSYPCVIQAADGRIHVTYTFRRYSIKHVELNEDWLVHMTRPN